MGTGPRTQPARGERAGRGGVTRGGAVTARSTRCVAHVKKTRRKNNNTHTPRVWSRGASPPTHLRHLYITRARPGGSDAARRLPNKQPSNGGRGQPVHPATPRRHRRRQGAPMRPRHGHPARRTTNEGKIAWGARRGRRSIEADHEGLGGEERVKKSCACRSRRVLKTSERPSCQGGWAAGAGAKCGGIRWSWLWADAGGF